MAVKNIDNIYEQLEVIKARLSALETPKEEVKVEEEASGEKEEVKVEEEASGEKEE